MKTIDIGRALLVVLIWGLNFTAIKIGLQHIPPFALGALRFTAVAFPMIFFVKRPALPLRWLFAYAICISFGQFAFLFVGMKVGMPAGIASLVLQASAFFTVIFSAYFFKESIQLHQITGMLISAMGLICLGAFSLMQHIPNHVEISLIGFLFTLCAAISWALGNVINKRIAKETPVPLLSLVIWGALLVIPFFFASALWFEGVNVFSQVLIHATWQDVGAIAYIAYLATIVGYVLWGNLLARYPAAWVAPITLMVPPIGLTSAYILLDEQLATWQVVGIIITMFGLLLNVFGSRLSHLIFNRGA